jgi:hypothetical protein
VRFSDAKLTKLEKLLTEMDALAVIREARIVELEVEIARLKGDSRPAVRIRDKSMDNADFVVGFEIEPRYRERSR